MEGFQCSCVDASAEQALNFHWGTGNPVKGVPLCKGFHGMFATSPQQSAVQDMATSNGRWQT